MNDESLIKEVVLNAPPSKVWKAITDRNQMKEWYFDIPDFKPEIGFEFQFTGTGNKGKKYLHLCKVTEVVPNKKISYSWKYENYPGNSFVTFELLEEKGKTRLKLTHEGVESFAIDNPDFAKDSFNAGWTELIEKSIKDFVERSSQ